MSEALSRSDIRRLGLDHGFDACRFAEARLPATVANQLADFVGKGRHGTMAWMEDTMERRKSPEHMWKEARSAIVFAMNYGPDTNPMATLEQRDRATISVYARNRDYHELIKGRLKQIAQKIASRNNCAVKVFVDTAPLMEKPLAHQAGLGWQGKHTNLVSRDLGSWFFIGTILTDAEMVPDEPETDHCGSCRACLDICPTDAFPAPYKLDARRCISYLTIEHKGPIDRNLRPLMGNRIYGCDDCLAVCPWNKFAEASREIKLQAREDLNAPELSFLAGLDDSAFRTFFSGSPVKRIGRNRFLRNVLIAIGNSGDPAMAGLAERHLSEDDPMVRGAAVWALAQLIDRTHFLSLLKAHMGSERDDEVLLEWQTALDSYDDSPKQEGKPA